MTQARSQQISLEATPYYHCINRCVRRAFLCGEDRATGASYEHRKEWVVTKVAELAGVFAIDVCAYAVLSNHYHLVLRVDEERALCWGDEEVAKRWLRLFKGHQLVSRWLQGKCGSNAQEETVQELLGVWRKRLMDISWFMRCLNEAIARQANAEDGCTGRFWEGRFKSQALLDEKALLACMTYVDLNPVRAGLAETPEESDFTSIQQRIQEAAERLRRDRGEHSPTSSNVGAVSTNRHVGEEKRNGSLRPTLMNFAAGSDENQYIPYDRMSDYLDLVEWTGKGVVPNKRGAFPEGMPPIIEQLGFDEAAWFAAVNGFEKHFREFVGDSASLRRVCAQTSRRWIRGSRACSCFDGGLRRVA